MSLFSYQGSFFVAVSAATSLLYQALFCLSRTFLTFSKVFLKFFRNSLSEYWFYHCFSLLSTTFFNFLNFLFFSVYSEKIRRRRDLNPRTAWTVYTLSRGASSATWVLLQIHCIQFWIAFISDAFEIILYEFTFVNAFFNFFKLFILYHRNALFSRSFFNRIVKAMTQIITESSEPAAVASPMK